ncbi:MAG: DNA recombination protein RmuC [Myxococcota bacterium]
MASPFLVVLAVLCLLGLGLIFVQGWMSLRDLRILEDQLEQRSRETEVETEQQRREAQASSEALHRLELRIEGRLGQIQRQLGAEGGEARERLLRRLHEGLHSVRGELQATLDRGSQQIDRRMAQLVETTDQRLRRISGKVEERLSEGFEKTNATFTKVMMQLARMDEAQKRLQELSSNVVSLQEVLADRKSLGAFGEVQLEALVENMLPPNSYAFQPTLRNGRRPDCALLLPEPTGTICIDAKFPLGDFQRFTNPELPEVERRAARKRFPVAVKGHIDDVAEKYILDGETWSGAFMFIPSEAVFAEIHARHPELVTHAQQRRIFLASPSTLMAVCTTAATVLKDRATRDQVHVIQDCLGALGSQFDRFHEHLQGLSKNIRIASEKANKAEREAERIRHRFRQIEGVELDGDEPTPIRIEERASQADT